MSVSTRLRPVLPVLGLLLAGPALAEPPAITADGAQQIAQGVKAWLDGLIGPVADVSGFPLQVEAGDADYRLALPLGMTLGDGAVVLGDGQLVAQVKPLDDHRWAIESLRMPSPWSLKLEGKLAGELPDRRKGAPGHGGLRDMVIKIDEQHVHGVFDPTLATPSRLDVAMAGYSAVTSDKQGGAQSTRIGRLTGHTTLQPGADGLVTLTSVSSAENYAIEGMLPDGKAMAVTMGRGRSSVTASALDLPALGRLVRSISQIVAAAREEQAKGGMAERPKGIPEADRPKVRAFVRALGGLVGSMTGEVSYDDIKLSVDGQGGSLHHVSVGFDMAAPKGKGELGWRIALDGLDSPMIPPGAIRELVPQHVTFSPRIAGLPKQDIEALALKAIDDPGAVGDFMNVAAELLDKGPVRVAIGNIGFDLGPATVSGGGGVDIVSPVAFTGGANFRMTGLDALIRKANGTPELQQAAPMLIFLKGIGRQEGEATVWKIRYADNKLFVNDTDMTGMMHGGK